MDIVYLESLERLALALVRVGAIEFLPSCEIKCNLHTPGHPIPGPVTNDIIKDAATCMYTLMAREQLHCDAIVGMPRSGDQLAKTLAGQLHKEFIILEWQQGEDLHPTSLKAPVFSDVDEVLLVDDLFLTAQSKLEAMRVLGEAGISVSDIVVLLDYENVRHQGELKAKGCTVHSIFTIASLLDILANVNKIDFEFRMEILRHYRKK